MESEGGRPRVRPCLNDMSNLKLGQLLQGLNRLLKIIFDNHCFEWTENILETMFHGR